ncbi:cardiolipin synthase [Tumebacillus sp. ITR2]|uniref:Cardiolipin synthase n=1 Tax=Tumebacillus amylolyticus TaxID=2801339 RepID=A0ABS1J9Q3_9BACL|nr:cardiolipin synthase [Tumebacillus amylolyticus]MBL0386779.1 cardiolipin synthase [Tumebacillus amylolyticus]
MSWERVVIRIAWTVAVLLFMAVVVLLLVGTVIFLENRNPEKTVAWLIILIVLPVIGFLLYLVFGRNARKRKLFHHKHNSDTQLKKLVHEQSLKMTEDELLRGGGENRQQRLVRLLLNSAYSPLTTNNSVRVLTDGPSKFEELFHALERAEHHIHLEYYIFKEDEIGRDIQRLLIQKARRGIEVRVLIDGLGSREISRDFLDELSSSGVQVEYFFPVKFPFITSRLNFRNHRKIVVVDGKVGFLGGMNIGDEYLSRKREFGFWRDTHLVLEGESAHRLQTIFLNDWYFITRQRIEDERYYPPLENMGSKYAQIVASGPDSDWESIRQVYFTAVATAREKVYIETPYFIPDESISMALKTAALSGLDVRLIVQGIPEYQLTYWASRSYFEELLQAGVKIYKYQKGILHAKVIMIDDEIGIVGSANMDIRSFQLNFEASALVYDRNFVKRLQEDFTQDIEDSILVELESYKSRPLSDRFKESGARLLSPLL